MKPSLPPDASWIARRLLTSAFIGAGLMEPPSQGVLSTCKSAGDVVHRGAGRTPPETGTKDSHMTPAETLKAAAKNYGEGLITEREFLAQAISTLANEWNVLPLEERATPEQRAFTSWLTAAIEREPV